MAVRKSIHVIDLSSGSEEEDIQLSSGSEAEKEDIIIGSPAVRKPARSQLTAAQIEKRAKEAAALTAQYGEREDDCGWGVKICLAGGDGGAATPYGNSGNGNAVTACGNGSNGGAATSLSGNGNAATSLNGNGGVATTYGNGGTATAYGNGGTATALKSLSLSVVPQLHARKPSLTDRGASVSSVQFGSTCRQGAARAFSVVVFAGADAVETQPLISTDFDTLPPIRLRVDFSQITNSASFTVSCPWLTKCFTKKISTELQRIYERKNSLLQSIEWLESNSLSFLDILKNCCVTYVTPDVSFRSPFHIVFDDPESVLVFYESINKKTESLRGTVLATVFAFDCAICYDHKPAMTAILFPGCRHFFCRTCVSEDLSLKVQEGQVKNLTCLEQGCKSLADMTMMRDLVDKARFQRYCELMAEEFVDGSTNIIRCPRKECSAPLELFPNNPRDVQCLTCLQAFCTTCKAVPHPGLPCLNEAQKTEIRLEWKKTDGKNRQNLEKRFGKENIKFVLEDAESEEWIGKNSKKCPKCATPIEKMSGCNKMICMAKGCHAYFCWLCNEELNKVNPYLHFHPTPKNSCGGRLYEQVTADGRILPPQPPQPLPLPPLGQMMNVDVADFHGVFRQHQALMNRMNVFFGQPGLAAVRQVAPPPVAVRQVAPPAVVRQMAPPLAAGRQVAPPPGAVRQVAPPPGAVRQVAPPAVVRQVAPLPAVIRQGALPRPAPPAAQLPPRRPPVPHPRHLDVPDGVRRGAAVGLRPPAVRGRAVAELDEAEAGAEAEAAVGRRLTRNRAPRGRGNV